MLDSSSAAPSSNIPVVAEPAPSQRPSTLAAHAPERKHVGALQGRYPHPESSVHSPPRFGGAHPLLVDPAIGAHRFVPSSWSDVLVGDELYSRSGTRRIVLAARREEAHFEFDFLTLKPGKDPYRERFSSMRLLIDKVDEIQRSCRYQFERIEPGSWNDCACGDLIITAQGDRKVVTGVEQRGRERVLAVLVRRRNGSIGYDYLKPGTGDLASFHRCFRLFRRRHTFFGSVGPSSRETSVRRAELAQQLSVPLAVMSNVEVLLGRGGLGDEFMVALWREMARATPDNQGVIKIDLGAAVSAADGELLAAEGTVGVGASAVSICVHDDSRQPALYAAVKRPHAMQPAAANHLLISLLFANALRVA